MRLVGRWATILWLLSFVVGALPVSAQRSLADIPFFTSGSEAYQEGDFATAAAEFQRAWSVLGNQADVFDRSVVASRLIESLYRNGDGRTAVLWYRGIADMALSREAQKWVALSMLEAGYFEESIAFLETLTVEAGPDELRWIALLKAHAYFRFGNPEQAHEIVKSKGLVPANPEDGFFFAGIAYEAKEWDEALDRCQGILSGEIDRTLRFKVELLRARAMAGAGDSDGSVRHLLGLIDDFRDEELIYRAFDVLMQSVSEEIRDLVASAVAGWQRDSESANLRMAADYYGILIDSDPREETIINKLETFIGANSQHPLAREALLMVVSLRPGKALNEILISSESDVISSRGRLDFETIIEMAGTLDRKQREMFLFNAAISALCEGEDTTFDSLENEIEGVGIGAVHADLLFLSGLYYASQANPQAFSILSEFPRQYPEHPSVFDAKLALAEMHLNQVPPQPGEALKIIEELRPLSIQKRRRERLDYAEIWVELLSPRSTRVLEATTAFLVAWPDSRFNAEVTMLMAMEFFEMRNFAKARESFEAVARDYPESEFADTALFFSAKASEMSGDELAGAGWDEVILSGGELANLARHQKAIDLLRQDRFDEAIRIFDQIIRQESAPVELRVAARCDKGFALYLKAISLGADRKFLEEASGVFGNVFADDKASRAWRFQAAVRRGKCLELLGRELDALEVYQSVNLELDRDSAPQVGSSPRLENNWLFRAGFAAIDILERKKDWKGAVELAETLAERSGPRAIEAARKAERLRLRNFVWD